MATSAAERQLRKFYSLWSKGAEPGQLKPYFNDKIWYIQLNTQGHLNANGLGDVASVYVQWRKWFRGMRLSHFAIGSLPQYEVERVGGAVNALHVMYSLRGVYVSPIPGLRDIQLELGRKEVTLEMIEKVWMTPAHCITRVINSIHRVS